MCGLPLKAERSLSEKIRLMSLWATIMVVYRHSLNYLAFFGTWQGEGPNGFIQDGFMTFTQIAVPYFFLVSGFFFFKHDYYKRDAYWKMLQKKAKSLFIPFVIWNVVGVAILWITGQLFNVESVWNFILQFAESKFYGPLWYVRDLLCLMLLVPLYQWIYRYNSKVIYVLIGLFLYWYWIPVDCRWFSSEGLFFFFLAGIINEHKNLLEKQFPFWIVMGMLILWMGLSFFTPVFQYLHKFCTLLGIITFWLLMDHCRWLHVDAVKKLAQFSFIIYVLHFYPLKIMKVYMGKMFYGNEWMSLMCYLLLPLVTCGLCVLIGIGMKRYIPWFYRISTGNR